MTVLSRHSAEPLVFSQAKMGSLQRFKPLLGMIHSFVRQAELTAHQRYDAGLTDLRPIQPNGTLPGFEAYPSSLAAMLNRSI